MKKAGWTQEKKQYFREKSRPKEQAGYSVLIIRPEDGSSETVHLPTLPMIK